MLVLAGGLASVLFKKRGKIVRRVEGKPARNLRDGKPLPQQLPGPGDLDIIDEGPGCSSGLLPEFRFEPRQGETAAGRGIFQGDRFVYMLMDIDDGFADLIRMGGFQLPGKQDDAVEAAGKKLLSQRLCDWIGGRQTEKASLS